MELCTDYKLVVLGVMVFWLTSFMYSSSAQVFYDIQLVDVNNLAGLNLSMYQPHEFQSLQMIIGIGHDVMIQTSGKPKYEIYIPLSGSHKKYPVWEGKAGGEIDVSVQRQFPPLNISQFTFTLPGPLHMCEELESSLCVEISLTENRYHRTQDTNLTNNHLCVQFTKECRMPLVDIALKDVLIRHPEGDEMMLTFGPHLTTDISLDMTIINNSSQLYIYPATTATNFIFTLSFKDNSKAIVQQSVIPNMTLSSAGLGPKKELLFQNVIVNINSLPKSKCLELETLCVTVTSGTNATYIDDWSDNNEVIIPLENGGAGKLQCPFDKEPPILRCKNQTYTGRAHWAYNFNYPPLHFEFEEISDNWGWGGVRSVICEPYETGHPIGTTVSTCTATDDAGNTATCNNTVIIKDIHPPKVYCPPHVAVASDMSYSTAIVNWTEPITYSDNSGVDLNITCSHASGYAFPSGETTVTCTSDADPGGLIGICYFTVTVFYRTETCYTLKLALERDFPDRQPEDGWYEIDPSGPNGVVPPFQAFCNMTTGFTNIHHNTEDIDITGPAGDTSVYPVYDGTVIQIEALINSSRVCWQYLEVASSNSRVFDQDLNPLKWWVSVTGQNMMNWGTPTGIYGCSCSMRKNCINREALCNCDISNGDIHSDGGRLIDKSTLPVYSVHLGDIEAADQSVRLKLGALECNGSMSPLADTIDMISPQLQCPASKVIRGGDVDTGTLRMWWTYFEISTDSDHLASITCDTTMGSEFTTEITNPTHVICLALDEVQNTRVAECGFEVQFAYPFTCHEIKMQYPDSPNGIFMIDPTGPVDDAVLPFEVFCDMSSDMGKTILNQTLHQEGDMFHVSYDNNVTQVVAVIDRSVHCRQLLKLKCSGNYTGSRQMSWKSRSNEVMYNWATPTGSRGCPYVACKKQVVTRLANFVTVTLVKT